MKADINQLKDQVNQILEILKNLRTTNDTFPSQSKEQTFYYPPRFYPRTHDKPLVCMAKHNVHKQQQGIQAHPFPLHGLPLCYCSKNQVILTSHHANKAILQVNAQDHTQTYVHTSDKMSLISEGEGNKLEATQVTRKEKALHITTSETYISYSCTRDSN